MAEKKIKWTEQQQRAIAERGSDILVTASAGTGKTAVLSGRYVNIISDKSECPDVWSILVLTFTNAAAEQMRLRIAGQLHEAFVQSKDEHLRYQLMLLPAADISTIHSFCKRLISEHFYKLGLDPTFRVIESDEQNLLKAEALEKTIDWAWQQSNLTQSLGELLYRRDLRTNDGFLAGIIDLSNFLDGVVSRDNWYERAVRLAEAVNPFTTELGVKQKKIVSDKLQHILEQMRYAQSLYKRQNADGDWNRSCEQIFIRPVSRCLELLKAGDWDKCAKEIRSFVKPTVYRPKGLEQMIGGLIQKTVKKAVDAFEGLSEFAVVNPEYLDRIGGAVGLQTRVLVELVRKFDRLYSQAKRAANCLDFADLEHYALRLLTNEDSSEDDLSPSETALMLRTKYKYIFVDEYQDINPVQQGILDLLSSEDNIFVVGDVKQSIYGFRGAKSDAFVERLKSASADNKKASRGLRVDLNANFRSAEGILGFVNKIFGRIMTGTLAKIKYDESAELKPALQQSAAGDTEPVVELHILDEESNSESESDSVLSVITSRQRQAVMIGQRIRQMVGADTGKAEFKIYDKEQDKIRDVRFSDIVILMRSPSHRVNDYVEVFQLAGVPVSCDTTGGYFEKTEVSDLICLLKVLDNPQRDIELTAVLRSPFFRVSDSELVEIKIYAKANEQCKNFYDCVLHYAGVGRDAKLAGKLEKPLEQIEQWRNFARAGSLADLIWLIYRQSGVLSFVCALPNGPQRKANLLKLHDRAIEFEGFASSSGKVSLTRFVEFIEKLQQAGHEWTSAEPEDVCENAVRIISVHKSKGLEFPVVFLAEMDSPFNKRDSQGEILAEVKNTLGLQIIEPESNSKFSSLAHQVIREQRLSAGLAEEMRILYVAMTRARERLILTACGKKNNCRDIICSGYLSGGKAVADWQLRSCRSTLEWLLYGLCDSKGLHEAFESGVAVKADRNELFSLKVYGQAQLEQLCEFVVKLKSGKTKGVGAAGEKQQSKQTDTKLLGEIKKSLAWRYGFGDAPLMSAKSSVTELTHRDDEYVKFDYSKALDRQPEAVLGDESIGRVDSRIIGTATHLVIARLDLTRPVTEEAIERTKEKLLAEAAIPDAAGEYIKAESIAAFFQSRLGKKTLAKESCVRREWPFSFAVQADDICSDEVVIVQGIIDMLIETAEGLDVIDFKTDNITAAQAEGRAGLYREQLELYSKAAEAILKIKIAGKWLYFLNPHCAVEIKD